MNGYIGKLLMYIPKNIGAVIGVVQTVVSGIKELAMVFARFFCGLIPGDADDKVVAWIKKIADIILEFLEKFKNWLLGLGFKI